MGLLTVSNVSRTPRVQWPTPAMPQHNTRRASSDFDAIDPAFPPPSLKTPQSEAGWNQDKRKKKDKKWSIGGLFRRKKKVSDTDSSSPVEDEEEKKGFLERRRAARKKRNRGSKDVTGSFEHVIINPPRNHRLETTASNENLMRDNCNERTGEALGIRQPEVNQIRASSVSLEGTGRKGGRIKNKSRVDANRGKLKPNSSSDEGCESSRNSTSSIQKMKSDDTSGSKDGSLSRRSRAARTERYKKRLSRDDESLKDFQGGPPSRISRSDERLSNKKTERASSGSRWTAKVVYCESSDYDTKYTAKTKSATPSPIQSPKTKPKNALHYTASAPASSTYVTFPPSHAKEGVARSYQELRSYHPQGVTQIGSKPIQRVADSTPPRLPKSNSDMIGKAPFSAPKTYPSWGQDVLNRKSASYDCNVNSLHYINNQISTPHRVEDNVLVVQFPISRPSNKTDTKVNKLSSSTQTLKQSNPPPPPPRDPHRRLVSSNGYIQENNPRPMSYAFEDRNQHQSRYSGLAEFGSSVSAFQRVPQTTHVEFQPASAINRHHRSNSDHQIPSRVNLVKNSPPMSRRPPSTHPEAHSYPVNVESFTGSPPDVQAGITNSYQYFTDQQPRSRKPIHITCQQQQKVPNDSYLSDSQVVIKPPVLQTHRTRPSGVQNATDFWKQKDQESAKKIHVSEGSPKLIQRHLLNVSTTNERSRSHSPNVDSNVVTARMKLPPLIMPVRGVESPGSMSSQSSPRDIPSPRTPIGKKLVHNEIGIPVFDSTEIINNQKRDFRPLSMLEEKQETSEQEVSPMRERLNNPPIPPTRRDSKVNAVTNFEHFDILDDDFELKEGRRKSSNLEEALNELEAIYKSLRLGEEGYIEKVAKEKAVYENNRLDPSNWNAWVQSRGFESDSSFNYSRSSLESVDSVDSPIKRSSLRKSGVPDRVTDDMAYRRLNKKDRLPPQEQEVISQAGSFLLVSPTLSPPPFIEPPPVPTTKNEPDITLDDVVYRNITHINNSLKVLDPQPPFGIPLGPITPAPNSDYLHATPKEMYRPTFKPRKTPDIVADDLAFRNLRKDSNKEPLFTPEDTTLIDSPTLKKKRAVRSLSANLLSIIQKESLALNNNKLVYNNNNIPNDIEKSQSFSNVANANIVNGQSFPRHQLEENRKLYDMVSKKNLSGEDSDPTPRGSRIFSTDNSSPLMTTSSETLTGSISSVRIQDSKQNNHILSQNPSPRLSLTPERRHTTDNIQLHTRKSLSPVKHISSKLEPFKNTISLHQANEFRRSPTPDSHTFTHHSDLNEEKPQSVYNQTESDLLAALAREAKEASEQLSKELNELNFDKVVKPTTHMPYSGSNHMQEQETTQQSIYEKTVATPVHLKPLSLGKITPHKPVKLNTFCITSDNKLEGKETLLMNSPGDIEGSKSMTDLLKELTKGLDLDFGDSPDDTDTQTTSSKTEELLVGEEKIEMIQATNEPIENKDVLGSNESRTTVMEVNVNQKYPSEHKLSTPERQLLSSFPDSLPEGQQSQRKQTSSPVNRFPLRISGDTTDEEIKSITQDSNRTLHEEQLPASNEVHPADDSRPSGECLRDCSSLADEGTKSVPPCDDPSTLLFCMACAHQLAGLDFLTILGLILAMASLILFLIL